MAELKYFISYSRKDSAFVLELAKELRDAGVNLWLDQLDILGGDRWDRAVEKALQTCQAMIAVLSPESVASNHVMDEISFALGEEKLVIPVIVQSCEVPFRLRRLQYIDFTANYQTGFSQLLKALHIERVSPAVEPSGPKTHIPTDQGELRKDSPGESPRSASATGEPPHGKTPTPPEPKTGSGRPTWRQRLIGALVGFVIGIWGGVLYILVCTTAGALCGTDRQVIKAAAIGCLVAGISGAILIPRITGKIDVGMFFGLVVAGPIGALGGALVGVYRKKRRVTQ